MKTCRPITGMLIGVLSLASLRANADTGIFFWSPPGTATLALNYSDPTGATGTRNVPISAGITGTQKAMLVADALITDPIFKGRVSQIGNRVLFADPTVFDITDPTQEDTWLFMAGKVFPNGRVEVADSVQAGFSGSLSGHAADGSVSAFSTSIAFGNVDDVANLSYSTLSSPTIDGLLTDTFHVLQAGLPADLRSNLSLDLSADRITFIEPPHIFNARVCVQATDTLVTTHLELIVTPTPEASSLLLFGAGALVPFVCAWRCRKNAA